MPEHTVGGIIARFFERLCYRMQQLIQGGYGFDELSKAMMIGVCKNRKTILRVPKDKAG